MPIDALTMISQLSLTEYTFDHQLHLFTKYTRRRKKCRLLAAIRKLFEFMG